MEIIKKNSTYNFLALFMCLIVAPCYCTPKVLIITHAFNRPDFINIQHATFKKFLIDDYEFVVFNDAPQKKTRKQIKKLCQKLGLHCVEIPQEIHDRPYLPRMRWEDKNNPCCRCANVVQYSLDVLGFVHNGPVAIIDSDMFLIKSFSIVDYLKNYDIAGIAQNRKHVNYVWNGIVFFNMNALPNKHTINFNCGIIDNEHVDVGGYTYYYFKNNPHVRFGDINQIYANDFACETCKAKNSVACPHNREVLEHCNFDEAMIRFLQAGPHNMQLILDRTFLHYRAGGNWDSRSSEYHQQKTQILNEFMNSILS